MASKTVTAAALAYWRGIMEDSAQPEDRRDRAATKLLSHGAASARNRAKFKNMKTKLATANARIKELEKLVDLQPEPTEILPMVGRN